MIDLIKNIRNYDSILGINERNLRYIKPYNLAQSKKLADDKLKTKKLLQENGIETPRLLGKIKSTTEFEKFKFNKLPGSIVVKPKKGFGGEGIVVFFSKDRDGNWVKADKTRYTKVNLQDHVLGILEGNFSLKNAPDTAFFEERVLVHPSFKKYSYKGVPDIRIIVFNKVPVMAMLRLATKSSNGKGNIHSGGIGVGLDIETGISTYAVQRDNLGRDVFLDTHPDFGIGLRGIKIPYWRRILDIAVNAQILSNLGFIGVDIVIDQIKGPLVIELNARPGLAIQLANYDGLKGRLNRISGLKIKNAKKGIEVGKNLFGGEIEEGIEEMSGKQLVGFVEYAKFKDVDGNFNKVKVKNDTGALWSSIDVKLASKLGFDSVILEFEEFTKEIKFMNLKEAVKAKLLALKHFEDHKKIVSVALVKQTTGMDLRPIIEIEFEMSGIKQMSKFTISKRKDLVYDSIIGRKALKSKFLVDPERKFLGE